MTMKKALLLDSEWKKKKHDYLSLMLSNLDWNKYERNTILMQKG